MPPVPFKFKITNSYSYSYQGGQTPLHVVVWYNRIKCLKLLILDEEDANIKDKVRL